jgi:hypothetical protein
LSRDHRSSRLENALGNALAYSDLPRLRAPKRIGPSDEDLERTVPGHEGGKAHARSDELVHVVEETLEHLVEIETARDGPHGFEKSPR